MDESYWKLYLTDFGQKQSIVAKVAKIYLIKRL